MTLIELLIVVIILGALAAIAIPRITTSATTAKANVCKTNIATLNTSIEMWNNDKGSYPADFSTLTSDPCYFPPGGTPVCPFNVAYVIGTDNRITATTHNH